MRLSTTSQLRHTTLNIARIRHNTTRSHQSRLRDLPTQIRDPQSTLRLHALRHHPRGLPTTLASTRLQRVALPSRSNHLNTHLVRWDHHPPSHTGISLTRRDIHNQRHRQAQLLVQSISHLCRTLHQAHRRSLGNPNKQDMVARSDHMVTLSNANSTCMILRVLSTT
jgi:hypothetical protein